MLDDFDTQIQCEEMPQPFIPSEEDYAPWPPSHEEDDGEDEINYDEDEEDEMPFPEDPEDDMVCHEDLSKWFTEDGGLTADAYEWLAEQDSQKSFC